MDIHILKFFPIRDNPTTAYLNFQRLDQHCQPCGCSLQGFHVHSGVARSNHKAEQQRAMDNRSVSVVTASGNSQPSQPNPGKSKPKAFQTPLLAPERPFKIL